MAEIVDIGERKAPDDGRRGAVAALIALVVVLAGAFAAYSALDGLARENQAETFGRESPHDPDMPQLADYNPVVYDASGQARSLQQIADGKPLVVNFWATWCPYCVQEMGDFQELCNEYADRVSFAFVDVADGTRETVDDARTWLAENGYELPDYYDTDLAAMRAYGASSLPTTAIIAANGDIWDVSPGAIDPARMRETLDAIVKS